MAHSDAHDRETLQHYEALIFSTTRRYVTWINMDFEDIQQVLRIKVFRALLAFDEERAKGLSRDRFVFSCVRNQIKDLIKRKRYPECFIDDVARVQFENGESEPAFYFHERYLSTSHDDVYGHLEAEPLHVPSTLSEEETQVAHLLAAGYRQIDAQRQLGYTKTEFDRHVKAIREKMADWAPSRPTNPPADPSTKTDRCRSRHHQLRLFERESDCPERYAATLP